MNSNIEVLVLIDIAVVVVILIATVVIMMVEYCIKLLLHPFLGAYSHCESYVRLCR